jgi:16S rRNA (cytosine967-C5)-methyltransferase
MGWLRPAAGPLGLSRVDAAVEGLDARRLAWQAVTEVLKRRSPLDDVFDELAGKVDLDARDIALAKAIAVVTFRRLGTLRHALAERLDKGLPKDQRLLNLLSVGAAQVLFLDVPDHAAVDTAVRIAGGDQSLKPMSGLVNAVLRRVARERDAILGQDDPWRDTPDWLRERWTARYGAEAQAIAEAHRSSASVDLTPKADPKAWAERLGGLLLPTGSIRLLERTAIRDLDGYEEGAWWVQDAAAALPARLLRPQPGERIADLCAAPGGKTAQLAAAGADVLAVDRSAKRLQRLEDNLRRLGLTAETRAIDAATLEGRFDAILLDAPCSATGTIRRHPDVAWTKGPEDVDKLAGLQGRLLDAAARLLRPGGRLVYCTCSLEPEEGERQAEAFLARHDRFERVPIEPDEVGIPDVVTASGDLRTLPSHLPLADRARSGLDGFFAARFHCRG